MSNIKDLAPVEVWKHFHRLYEKVRGGSGAEYHRG
jgi:hypothetical protein